MFGIIAKFLQFTPAALMPVQSAPMEGYRKRLQHVSTIAISNAEEYHDLSSVASCREKTETHADLGHCLAP